MLLGFSARINLRMKILLLTWATIGGWGQCTANPNPVQLTGFPCKSIPTGKNLLSLQGNPVLIAGSLFSLQGFPCISLYFPVRDCSVQCSSFRNYLTPNVQLEWFVIQHFVVKCVETSSISINAQSLNDLIKNDLMGPSHSK